MKQRDKLRSTLREYYDNQEVPFNDNEWERASAYLDAARRRNTIRNSAIVIAAVFAVLIIVLFYSPETASNEKLLSEQKSKPVSTSQGTVFRKVQVKSPEAKVLISQNKNNKHSATSTISQLETRTNIPRMPIISSNDKGAEIIKPKAAASEQKFTGQNDVLKEPIVNEKFQVKLPVTNAVVTATDNNPERDIKYKVPEDPKENVEIAHVKNINTGLLSPATNAAVAVSDKITDDIIKPEISEDPKRNEEIAPVTTENTPNQQEQFQAKGIPQLPVNMSSQITESVILDVSKKETASTDIKKIITPEKAGGTNVVDTTNPAPVIGAQATIENTTVDTLPATKSRIIIADEGIFYEVGVAWLYGWKGPVHRDARGLSPVVGIHYMNRLNRRCAFSFGLQYLQVSNLANSSKTSRVSSYIYGEQSSVTVITPSSAYYLVAPLRFHYHVNNKNSFGIGINVAYLLNVDATVTTHDEKPGFVGNYKTVKLGGYTQGFSWFDSQMAFCYRRKITNSFALQAEIFLGLIDVKQDEFFGFKNKERNSGGKLSLIYFASRQKSRK